MRKCTSCNIKKANVQFSWRVKDVRRHRICKLCQKAFFRTYYLDNIKRLIEKANGNNPPILLRGHIVVYNYLKKHPCVDCGEDNVLALEFDHIDPTYRVVPVATLVRRAPARILSEIRKCEVRCGSCHNIKTATQRGTIRYALVCADKQSGVR